MATCWLRQHVGYGNILVIVRQCSEAPGRRGLGDVHDEVQELVEVEGAVAVRVCCNGSYVAMAYGAVPDTATTCIVMKLYNYGRYRYGPIQLWLIQLCPI